MSDERLDRLIDEVARQMTDGHPSSDFQARVIANLDRRPGHVWRPIWIVAPLGTLAVVVLVVLVARPFFTAAPHRMQRATVDAPKRDERVGGQGRNRGAGPAPQPSRQALKVESGFGETRKPDAHFSDAAAAVAALAPPRLDLAPLAVDAIGVERLAGEPIAVRQLDTITPIAVDPIGSR